MKFQYKRLSSGIERPIIPIELLNGAERINDSGADISIFPGEIGELLGINVPSGKRDTIGGIVEGETRSFFIHPISFKVGGWRYDNVPVGFMPDLSKVGYGVLGQHGFFNFFVVKFTFSKREVELKDIGRS